MGRHPARLHPKNMARPSVTTAAFVLVAGPFGYTAKVGPVYSIHDLACDPAGAGGGGPPGDRLTHTQSAISGGALTMVDTIPGGPHPTPNDTSSSGSSRLALQWNSGRRVPPELVPALQALRKDAIVIPGGRRPPAGRPPAPRLQGRSGQSKVRRGDPTPLRTCR